MYLGTGAHSSENVNIMERIQCTTSLGSLIAEQPKSSDLPVLLHCCEDHRDVPSHELHQGFVQDANGMLGIGREEKNSQPFIFTDMPCTHIHGRVIQGAGTFFLYCSDILHLEDLHQMESSEQHRLLSTTSALLQTKRTT